MYNPKNEVVHELPPIFFKWLKNSNYRHISFTETCHCHSKLSKIISSGKTTTQFFNILENLQEHWPKTYTSGISWHCTKNEVFHAGFLQQMWLQIWSKLLKKSIMENSIFCGVLALNIRLQLKHATNCNASSYH